MRSDMNKVLVLRGRNGGHWAVKPCRRAWREDRRRGRDQERKREPMSRGRGNKYLGEYLAPLRRFLLSRDGQQWNAVYSEICQHIDQSNAVQRHILEHLWDYVERYAVFIDGAPHVRYGDRYVRLYRNRWRNCMYICQQGILRKSPPFPRRPRY